MRHLRDVHVDVLIFAAALVLALAAGRAMAAPLPCVEDRDGLAVLSTCAELEVECRERSNALAVCTPERVHNRCRIDSQCLANTVCFTCAPSVVCLCYPLAEISPTQFPVH
jgi:hypothetical protein